MINEKDYDYKITAGGRVNLIGEHIDYCGGKVFPAALSLVNEILVRKNGTDKINFVWSNIPDRPTIDVNKLDDYKDVKIVNYRAGSLLEWQKKGHKIIGADMYCDCRVPFGSGLSSSAAIEVSTIVAEAVIAGEPFDKVEVALCSQRAERDYCGVNCGIMDQYASACGKKGNAMLLNCKTLECEYVPVKTGDYIFIVIDSKKPHSLVDSKYNERRSETEQALEYFKKFIPVTCLAEVTIDDFNKYSDGLPEVIKNRAKHVVYECDRVNKAAECMKAGDMAGLGKLLNESHYSLRDLYEVTGAELDALQEYAVAQDGCVGSRMTGAGFGGSTVSIVKKDKAEEFKKSVCAAYKAKTGYDAKAYDCEISDGITVTKIEK